MVLVGAALYGARAPHYDDGGTPLAPATGRDRKRCAVSEHEKELCIAQEKACAIAVKLKGERTRRTPACRPVHKRCFMWAAFRV